MLDTCWDITSFPIVISRKKEAREEFRKNWLPDGRRISFKQLKESMRRRALVPFLTLAGKIHGNTITVLIDQRIKTFISGGPKSIADTLPEIFPPSTPLGTVEKMFRLGSLLAMIIAGLRDEHQASFWVSDHDETLSTYGRREELGKLANYLTYGLTGWTKPADMHFGTTLSEHAPEWAEDLTAIPDLLAGAFCLLGDYFPTHLGAETWQRTVSPSHIKDTRARAIGGWMANTNGQLHNILVRLNLDDSGEIRASAQMFARTKI